MFPLWFTICFVAVTLLELRSISYISPLWFTTCFGAKSIIITINQFTQATISVARLVYRGNCSSSGFHSSLCMRHLGNLLSFNIARREDILIKSVGTHSELICLGQRASVFETIRQQWRGTTTNKYWTAQPYIITCISYITQHISKGIRDPKVRVRA